jgi:glycosyltransferase involved in cell wall biosynthesis
VSRILLIFSLEAWDGVWRRNQYLVNGLLRSDADVRVVFVEPPRDLLHDIVARRRPRRGAGLRAAPGYEGRLLLFEPTKWLPRFVGKAADWLLRRSVHRMLRRIGCSEAIIWVNDPAWASLVEETGWPALYDMTDDWLAANRNPRQHDRIVAAEKILMRDCRAVVVCSPALLASRRTIRPDAVLVQNAVDVARYRTPAPRPADLDDMRYAVYVGTLHEDRLDLELVVATARLLHTVGARCVLVGPNALSAANTALLAAEPGILMLGTRPYGEVPAYLQHAHALIVPHVVDDFTDSLDPIKLYEYRAVGRPIVTTAVAGFRELAGQDGLYVVDRGGFAAQVLRTLDRDRKVDRVAVPDWNERIDEFAEVLRRIGIADEG